MAGVVFGGLIGNWSGVPCRRVPTLGPDVLNIFGFSFQAPAGMPARRFLDSGNTQQDLLDRVTDRRRFGHCVAAPFAGKRRSGSRIDERKTAFRIVALAQMRWALGQNDFAR